jgi:hypothetical protein
MEGRASFCSSSIPRYGVFDWCAFNFIANRCASDVVAFTGKSIIERTKLFKILSKVRFLPAEYGSERIPLRCLKVPYYTPISMQRSTRPISSNLLSSIRACIFALMSISPPQISSQTHPNSSRYLNINFPKSKF